MKTHKTRRTRVREKIWAKGFGAARSFGAEARHWYRHAWQIQAWEAGVEGYAISRRLQAQEAG